MAQIGNWRENKDTEMELDGIGGVNILVKADVHRSGMSATFLSSSYFPSFYCALPSIPFAAPVPPSACESLYLTKWPLF